MLNMVFYGLHVLLLVAFLATVSTAWTTPIGSQHRRESTIVIRSTNNVNDDTSITTRRELLHKTIRIGASTPAAALTLSALTNHPESASASTRPEEKKCDPGDARCRQGGELADDVPSGQPIPAVTNRITYVVQMIVDVGERRENDAGYLRFGLYGDDCPGSVKQLLLFLTRGIKSMNMDALEDALEVDYAPVSLMDGSGSVQNICSGKGIDFGVPSQSKAYSRSRGLRTAGPYFVPQGRPTPTLEGEAFPRPHSVAGLISVPAKGIGYGDASSGGGIIASELSDDEIFASAFTITAQEAPALDKPNTAQQQRVIGQIIDNESMQFLERLANLPVQKKVGKVSSGPPLLKVRVRDVDVQKVKNESGKKGKKKSR